MGVWSGIKEVHVDTNSLWREDSWPRLAVVQLGMTGDCILLRMGIKFKLGSVLVSVLKSFVVAGVVAVEIPEEELRGVVESETLEMEIGA